MLGRRIIRYSFLPWWCSDFIDDEYSREDRQRHARGSLHRESTDVDKLGGAVRLLPPPEPQTDCKTSIASTPRRPGSILQTRLASLKPTTTLGADSQMMPVARRRWLDAYDGVCKHLNEVTIAPHNTLVIWALLENRVINTDASGTWPNQQFCWSQKSARQGIVGSFLSLSGREIRLTTYNQCSWAGWNGNLWYNIISWIIVYFMPWGNIFFCNIVFFLYSIHCLLCSVFVHVAVLYQETTWSGIILV